MTTVIYFIALIRCYFRVQDDGIAGIKVKMMTDTDMLYTVAVKLYFFFQED